MEVVLVGSGNGRAKCFSSYNFPSSSMAVKDCKVTEAQPFDRRIHLGYRIHGNEDLSKLVGFS